MNFIADMNMCHETSSAQHSEFLKTKSKLYNSSNDNLQIQHYFSTLLPRNQSKISEQQSKQHPENQQTFITNSRTSEINNNNNYNQKYNKDMNINNSYDEIYDLNEISNSLSFNSSVNSDEKTNSEQFLIDDEIADQPNLMTLLFSESKISNIFTPDYENHEPQSETNMSVFNELFACDTPTTITNTSTNRSHDTTRLSNFQFFSNNLFSTDHSDNKDFGDNNYDDDDDFLMETENEINDENSNFFNGDYLRDILAIKDMLFQLKKVLLIDHQKGNCFVAEGDNEEMSDFTNNYNNNNIAQVQITELNRQIEFLKSELEEKDRIINCLNNERDCFNFNSNNNHSDQQYVCNAATQTDKCFQAIPLQSNYFSRNLKFTN